MSVFFVAVMSANGKISRSHTAHLDWSSKADLMWFKHITTKVGVVVMGKKTFDTLNSPLPRRLNVVMSHKSNRQEIPNVLFTNMPPKFLVKMLKEKGFEDIAVVGGQSVFTLFLKEKLVDEMYLTYEPVIIEGIDFFSKLEEDVRMKVINTKSLDSGALVVHYKIVSWEKRYGREV